MRPVHVDGFIWVGIGLCTSIVGSLSMDDAAKWINPEPLWWWKNSFIAANATLLALKMYRSTAYAKDVQEQNGKEKPLTPPPEPPKPAP